MSTTAIFQTSRTASLIPADARNKKQLRAVVAAFAEQFAGALANRLVAYCRLSKTKTVTSETLQAVAEELLGAGSAALPESIDESRMPQTIIYSRFKRNLGGLRTDSKCASMAAVVGAHFLHFVRDLIDRAFAVEEPRSVTVQQVIASLERPGKYSPSGLPCIAYRHSDAIFEAAEPKEAAAAAPAAEAEAAAPATKGKKRARKQEAEVAAPEPVEAPVATKKRASKKAAVEQAVVEQAAPVEAAAAKKRRAPAKKAAAAATA
jgi:hypothetical protein